MLSREILRKMDEEIQARESTRPELVSIAHTARLLSLSPYTIYAHVKRGAIVATRCGRRVLVSRAEIERIRREGLPSMSQKGQ